MFVAPCNGTVHALDKATGVRRWSYDTRQDADTPGFHGEALVAGDLIVIGSDGPGVGHVYALDQRTGKPRWKYRTAGGVATGLVRDGDRVYAVTLEDELICLDLATGRKRWGLASGVSSPERLAVRATPAVAGEHVFSGDLNGRVSALATRSGERRWKQELGSAVATPLVVLAGSLYVGTRDGRLHRLALQDGAPLGRIALGGTPEGPPLLIDGAIVLLVNVDERGASLRSLDAALTRTNWARDPTAGRWTSARAYSWNGAVVAASGRGEVAAVSPADGSVLWSDRVKGVIRGIGSDTGAIYLGNQDGTIYAYVRGR